GGTSAGELRRGSRHVRRARPDLRCPTAGDGPRGLVYATVGAVRRELSGCGLILVGRVCRVSKHGIGPDSGGLAPSHGSGCPPAIADVARPAPARGRSG